MYGPAQFYVLAAFFKLLGISVWVGRLYDVLVRAGLACICFALTNRLASKGVRGVCLRDRPGLDQLHLRSRL
jgi:predicted membrane-bound mannosyltransferase